MKLFVTTDIHGYYDLLMETLQQAGFDIENDNHVFVSLGDLLDRGPQPRQCLQFVNSLPNDRKILIKGNHEELMEQMLRRGFPQEHDINNGTAMTVLDYYNIVDNNFNTQELFKQFQKDKEWNTYINSCINYWENNKYVFVHGWIPVIRAGGSYGSEVYCPKFTQNWRTLDWSNARWYNGMRLWEQGMVISGKTICCGHYHCSWGHSHLHNDGVEFLEFVETYYEDDDGRIHPYEVWTPFEDKGICALDACTAYTGKMNCKVIERVRQVDIEKGKGY